MENNKDEFRKTASELSKIFHKDVSDKIEDMLITIARESEPDFSGQSI
jgi:hypothetical protein